ncbi:MAG: hypothetical protein CMM59_05415 [Rhodospirillaceae bacterium]|nr:hypothetical protein [Rhodospirillaceae bacterium]
MTADLVPVQTEAPRFEDIVETYLARDYIKAGKFAESLVHEAGAIQGFLLSLIGLCRSGNARRAQQLAEIASRRLRPNDPWSADLVELAVGWQKVDALLSEELNGTAHCQILFYGAVAAVNGGDKANARDLLRQAIDLDAPCLELYLAQRESAHLESEDG